jgi:putative transcriptional regulator
MATSISKLQDRAAAVAALLEDLQKVEERSETQVAEIEKLQSEAGDLADKLEVSRQTINALETGKYDPSLPLAFRIARLFEQPIESIFDDGQA